jgi:hypothetical protein
MKYDFKQHGGYLWLPGLEQAGRSRVHPTDLPMASITDCVGTPAHEIPCTDLSNDTETTIGALADGKIAVLGAVPPSIHSH